MIPRNGSYFDQELCLDGHYIVTGYTNDIFCNDMLQVTDIRQELHRHLLQQGFEVVVFFDHNGMLYCYDRRSYNILSGEPEAAAPAEEEEDEFSALSREGPFGGSIWEEEQQPEVVPPAPPANRLHMGRLAMPNAWAQVLPLLRSGQHRCALVISNASSLQTSFQENALQDLQELTQNRGTNTCAVIYLFRGNSLDGMLNSAQLGTHPWAIFFHSTLRPLIQTDDPEQNRVISLRTPNAAEIRNLLNHMRSRREEPLNIRPQDLLEIATGLASSCADHSWSLRRLYLRLQTFAHERPDSRITVSSFYADIGIGYRRTALEDLDDLIGMEEVKEKIRQHYDGITMRRGCPFPTASSRFHPPARGGVVRGIELNVCIMGPAGTGKSTLARLLGRVYRETGYLPQGHLVPVSAGDLITQNVGGTPALVHSYVQQAIGGVLFIDEAYALAKSDHGREAIDQLVNDMTAFAGQFAVVIAGYPQDIQRLLQANDGLASRFGDTWTLPDYNKDEMRRIIERFVRNDSENIAISPALAQVLEPFCENWSMDHGREWANAREAEQLVAAMKRHAQARAVRSGMADSTAPLELLPEDIPSELEHHTKPKAESLEDALQQLKDMIGLKNVKRYIRRLVQGIRAGVADAYPGRFIFSGPPGTGKTHMARLMGVMLWRLGILKRAYVHEVAAMDLLVPDPTQDYGPGNRNPSYQEILLKVVENARGGILFIDEAHQLANTDEGRAVLRALIPIVENPEIRQDTCFIMAGYTTEMRNLLRLDDGFSRRFPVSCRIRFDNYTARELTRILQTFANARNEHLTEEYKARTIIALSKYLENPPENFGNAGFMRDTYLDQSINARSRRLSLKYGGDADAVLTVEQSEQIPPHEKRELTAEDLPESFAPLAGPLGLPVPEELSVWDRVDRLVGKRQLQEHLRNLQHQDSQVQFFDNHTATGLNFAIVGNIGTGRHTSARIISAVLKELGLLDRDEVRFVGKGDLEAGFVGQTAGRVDSVVERALGGCLAVEYPSSMLMRGPNDHSYGPEALAAITGAMAGSTEKLAVILLDTKEGMEETFRQIPDMRSRISCIFELEDLSPSDMETLFHQKTENAFYFTRETADLLPEFFLNWVSDRGNLGESVRTWGNGTELDRLAEALIAGWAKHGSPVERVKNIPMRRITNQMFPEALQKYLVPTREAADTAIGKLNDMVGLDAVKDAIRGLIRRLRNLGEGKTAPGCYAFLGNPGTGKTTVAKILGGVLRHINALSQGHVIERTAQQLAREPHTLDELLKLAKNGILFIDEAPLLTRTEGGQMVLNRLLTVLTDRSITDCTCIILAGYPAQMMQLIRSDPGLESRFGTNDAMIHFADYTAEQLLRILQNKAKIADQLPEVKASAPLELEDEYLRQTLSVFEFVTQEKSPTFGNARFAVNYLHDSYERLLERLDPNATGNIQEPEDMTLLTEEDIPSKYVQLLNARTVPATIPAEKLNIPPVQRITAENYEASNDLLARSTVLLECSSNGNVLGCGTGTILTKDGYILTCAHVIENADKIRAKIHCPGNIGGDFFWRDCQILRPVYKDCDMALLKMEGSNYPAMPLRPWDQNISTLEKTVMTGYPLGGMLNGDNLDHLQISSFEGRCSSKQDVPYGSKLVKRYYVDTTGLHGNSGSPVISQEDGRMIGVFSGSVAPKGGSLDEINLFFPISYFWSRFVTGISREEIVNHDES